MTITTTTRLVLYQGNGVTTVFPFAFLIPSQANLTVQLQDHDSGTLIQVLVPGSYVVSGFGNPVGGTVTYNPVGGPIASDVDIVIIRTMPYTQDLEIDNQGGFYPEAVTQQLDFIVMQIQQLAEEQSRSLIVAPGQEPPNIQEINDAVQAAADSAAAAAASEAAADASADAAAASEAAVANVVAYLNTSEYNYVTTTSYPPASGEVRLNNAAQASATFVYLSHLNARGVDLTNIIPIQMGVGSLLLVQDRTDISKYVLYKVSGVPVLSGADYQIPVVLQTNGSTLTAAPAVVGFGGGGGAASVTTSDTPPPLPRTDGQLWFDSSTGRFYVWYEDPNTSQWVQISAAPQVAAQNTRNRGHIDPGFNLANDTGDATNDIVIPTGVVASDVAPYPLMAHTQTIRQLDFAYGVNNGDRLGGRFDSAISDGWWRVFVIGNGTLVQSGMSKSADPTTQPNYPAGYTAYRRVGWILRSGGVIQAFFQDGDDYEWQSITSDFAVSNPGTAVVFRTLSAPPNTVAHVQYNLVFTDATPVVGWYVYRTDLVARNFPIASVVNASGRTQQIYGEFFVKVDSNSQVKTQVLTSTAGLSTQAAAMGWSDKRGRV